MFKTVGKGRDNYKRSILLISIAILTIYIFIINGDGAVTFLFLRSKFDWSLTQYQLYSSVSNILWIVGTVLGTYFLHKFLQVTESVLVLMGILCMLNSMLLQGLATKNWHIYACKFKFFRNKIVHLKLVTILTEDHFSYRCKVSWWNHKSDDEKFSVKDCIR